jgi:LasA protease
MPTGQDVASSAQSVAFSGISLAQATPDLEALQLADVDRFVFRGSETSPRWRPADELAGSVPASSVMQLADTSDMLSDGQFVYGPNVGSFDIATYLESVGSPLLPYADVLEDWCRYASVNPRVVLTLIQLRSGLVRPGADAQNVERLIGYGEGSFEAEVRRLTTELALNFYDHLYKHGGRSGKPASPAGSRTLLLADGQAVNWPASSSSGTYALAGTVASLATSQEFVQFVSPFDARGFMSVYASLFAPDNPLDQSNRIVSSSAPPGNLLQFPFPVNQTWQFNGMHNWNGSGIYYGRPYSSIDFMTSANNCSAPPSNDWAVAAAGGKLSYPNSGKSCWMQIDHGSGWTTSYYHLRNTVSAGSVSRNDKVGTIGCETCIGGGADWPHVHFSLLYNGSYFDLDNVELTGWTMHPGSNGDYTTGYIERSGVVKPPYTVVKNDYEAGGDSGDVAGFVKNARSGVVVSNANVTFTGGGITRSTNTYSNGWYLFAGVPAGSALITASRSDVGAGSVAVQVVKNSSVGAPDILLYPVCLAVNAQSGSRSRPDTCIMPTSTPVPDPTSTPPATSCPTDGRPGIYFYRDQNYQGACHFSTRDVADFANTSVGDNALSSMRVVGSWEVKIFENRNFGGRYDVLGHDEPNLDIRSLGGQYSSAKITNTTSTCPTDGSLGVYFYSSKNYGERCTFSTTDIADFGQTAIGDNSLSSIRFIGNWEAKIYEDVNFGGRYDVIGDDDPNLDIRSLGEQYSSVKIKSVVVPPTNTPTPTLTPAPHAVELLGPSVNNGGFEAGSMSGWTQSGGSFDVANDAPHSGAYYCKGTSATEAYFYKDLNLDAYAAKIDAGLASAYFGAWTHNGNSEWYRFMVRFLNQTGTELGLFDTGWAHDGESHYIHPSGSMPLIPQGSRSVRIEIHAKRTSGSYTDMDTDDVSFVLQYWDMPPTATPTPTPTSVSGGFGISVNGGSLYTVSDVVTLTLSAPSAVSMRLSNDGGFADNQWQPFAATKSWQLSSYGSYVLPRYVFVWFRDNQARVFGPYFDEIVLDPVSPTGSVAIMGVAGTNVVLALVAYDDNSGVGDMRIADNGGMANSSWQPYYPQVTWSSGSEFVYAQFRDRAGNMSSLVTVRSIRPMVYLPLITR